MEQAASPDSDPGPRSADFRRPRVAAWSRGLVKSDGRPQRCDQAARVVADEGLRRLYAASYADLTVQVYAYFGDLHEAQDVVQEAFCRALARWRQVSGYDDPAAWVRRVAWNLATSRWRRLRVMRAFHRRQRGEPVVAGPEPDHVALVEALASLPAAQRRAMVLRYLADLPVAEIADREGVPEGTVRSWLHRGRATLAARLGPEHMEKSHA
ncbi:SigE family RNA polymerase sigma factor [Micromonospora chalcea]|uniref:RNA polymerase sigma factor n=1 Tax=Micromonospora chalcea TaxID=1874 RepID=UPI0033DF6E2D